MKLKEEFKEILKRQSKFLEKLTKEIKLGVIDKDEWNRWQMDETLNGDYHRLLKINLVGAFKELTGGKHSKVVNKFIEEEFNNAKT